MSIIQPLGWMPVQREPEDISDVILHKKGKPVKLTRTIIRDLNYGNLNEFEELMVTRYQIMITKSKKKLNDLYKKEIELEKQLKSNFNLFGTNQENYDKINTWITQSARRILDIIRRIKETKKRIKDAKQKLKQLENVDARQKLDEARKQLRLLVPEKKENVSERKFQKARKQLTKQTQNVKTEKEKLERQIKLDQGNLDKFKFGDQVSTDPRIIAGKITNPIRNEMEKMGKKK